MDWVLAFFLGWLLGIVSTVFGLLALGRWLSRVNSNKPPLLGVDIEKLEAEYEKQKAEYEKQKKHRTMWG